MKNRLAFSFVLMLLILAYSLFFQILPVLNQIQSLKHQNQVLQVQLKSYPSQMSQSLSSSQVYAWLNRVHLSGLTLVDLEETKQGVHLILLLKPDVFKTFLDLASGSQFKHLQLSDLNGHQIKVDGIFSTLSLQTSKIVQPEKTLHMANPERSIGVVHQQGVQFCVMQTQKGIQLLRKDKC